MFLCVHQQSSLSISIRVCPWPETVLSMSICVRPSWPETVSPRVCPGLCPCFTLSPAGRGSTHASQAGFFYVFLIKFLTVRRAGSVPVSREEAPMRGDIWSSMEVCEKSRRSCESIAHQVGHLLLW